MLAPLVHGYLLSFGLILPLGPQNVFVFTQGSSQPRLARAMPVVLAASLADTLLILLAVLGVSVVVLALPSIRSGVMVAGVLFLLAVGWLTWRNNPAGGAELDGSGAWTLRRQVIFTLSVSLLNPHAIFDTVGVIGTTAMDYAGGERVAFTTACVVNSWLWFLLLAVAGRFLGAVDRVGRLRRWLNRVSACLMWFFALYLGWRVLGR